MKISELENAPQWLVEANVSNENVEIVDGRVIWHGGTWYGGTWHGGTWHGGTWHGGNWHGGDWHGGTWYGGTWYGGTWYGGTWHGGDWRGLENRLLYMASALGIVFGPDGYAYGYRSVSASLMGRHVRTFSQPLGEYYEKDIPDSGSGTCVPGIHVTSAARAWTYFGVEECCRFIKVRFRKEDLLDCDGEKCRIRGGYFDEIERPF